MSFVIAAAGTGGHVYPGLAVGEALLAAGVARDEVLFVGGDRVEARIVPDHGFPFIGVELRGLKRNLSTDNLTLPAVVLRARRRLIEVIGKRGVRSILGMGGYVTIPAALAARATSTPLFVAEQNAVAGLANKIASRWARRVFVSFPRTSGLPDGEWVGNPVRHAIAAFDRRDLRTEALEHYGLVEHRPVLGVFGGSLGAQAVNDAVAALATGWDGEPIQIVHLVGEAHEERYAAMTAAPGVVWARRGFESRMELFFAGCDLVVARAGGSVAEIVATATPSILIPGAFGSAGHQAANAGYMEREGAAVVLDQSRIDELAPVVAGLLFDDVRLARMAEECGRLARPEAAKVVADAMIESAA